LLALSQLLVSDAARSNSSWLGALTDGRESRPGSPVWRRVLRPAERAEIRDHVGARACIRQ